MVGKSRKNRTGRQLEGGINHTAGSIRNTEVIGVGDTAESIGAEHIADVAEIAFLVTASDGIAAEVYENMLIENGIPVVKKKCEPSLQGFIYVDYSKEGVNIFVPVSKLAKARELLEVFESESYSYDIPMEEYQRRLRGKKSILGFILLLFIFGAPVASAVIVVIYHLFFKK